MADRSYGINLVVNDKGIAVLDTAGNKVEKLGTEAAGAAPKLDNLSAKSVAIGTALGGLAIKGIDAVITSMSSAISSAEGWIAASNKQENAVRQLEASLRATGQFSEGLSAQYQALASSFQAVTTVGDEELLPLMGRLSTVGGIHADKMKAATQAALDYAAATGKGLPEAFNAVAKAAQGQTDSLREAGLVIQKTGDKSKDFDTALKLLGERFGGIAESQAATFDGKLKQISNRLGDMREQLGDVIKGALGPLVDTFVAAMPAVENFIAAHKADAVRALGTAILFVADSVRVGIEAGLLLADTYANIRKVFAEILLAVQPFIDKMATLADFLSKLPGGSIFEGVAEGLRDMSAGLEDNVRDQEEFQRTINEGTEAVRRHADEIRNGLADGLDAAAEAAEKTAAAATDSAQRWGQTVSEFRQELEKSRGKLLGVNESMGFVNDRIKEFGVEAYKSATTFGEMMRAAGKTVLATLAPIEERMAAIRAQNEIILGQYSQVTASRDITTEDRVNFDKGSSAYKSAVDQLKSLKGTGYASAGDSFRQAIESGDIGAARNIVDALQGQGKFYDKAGATGAGRDQLDRVAFMLSQLLGTLQKAIVPVGRNSDPPPQTSRPSGGGLTTTDITRALASLINDANARNANSKV